MSDVAALCDEVESFTLALRRLRAHWRGRLRAAPRSDLRFWAS